MRKFSQISSVRTCMVVVSLWISSYTIHAKVEHLLPMPKQCVAVNNQKPFALSGKVSVQGAASASLVKEFLKEHGCSIAKKADKTIQVTLVDSLPNTYDYPLAGYENEAYRLRITQKEIAITAVSKMGVLRAVQTLNQLAEGYPTGKQEIEAVDIVDYPSFKLRGYMHDTGRSYISFEELKRELRLLAHFKVNTFHWHLTENQAWRFEVKAFPQLTAAEHMTRHQGKYYTQQQCKELEAYARSLGIIVIPEIDMPGHSAAFVRAMGYDMQTDEGIATLKVILKEVVETFPLAPYIHIGGDEKPITYKGFIQTMINYVKQLGKKAIVWIPTHGSPAGCDMAQLWSTAGKAWKGAPNIDCRYNYTNHFDTFADIVGIYKSNVYYSQQGNASLAGNISAPWNDTRLPSDRDIIAQNNFYASVLASSARAWQGGGKRYIEQGGTRLPNNGDEYEDFCQWEQRFLFHKEHSLKEEPIPYVKQTNVRWLVTDPMPNNGSATTVLPPDTLGPQPYYTLGNGVYQTHLLTGAGIYLRHTWGNNVPDIFNNTPLGHTAYAWTYVYSPVEQVAGAFVEFQNYSRSEQDKRPEQGKWDRKGSRIWLNDTELLPPTWLKPGETASNESGLLNENASSRKPLTVKLQKGWNKVFMKLPYVAADGIRLNKWMFTFVLTDTEGKKALDNVTYQPYKSLK